MEQGILTRIWETISEMFSNFTKQVSDFFSEIAFRFQHGANVLTLDEYEQECDACDLGKLTVYGKSQYRSYLNAVEEYHKMGRRIFGQVVEKEQPDINSYMRENCFAKPGGLGVSEMFSVYACNGYVPKDINKDTITFENLGNHAVISVNAVDLKAIGVDKFKEICSQKASYAKLDVEIKDESIFVVSGNKLIKCMSDKETVYVPEYIREIDKDAFPPGVTVISMSADVSEMENAFNYQQLKEAYERNPEGFCESAGLGRDDAEKIISIIKERHWTDYGNYLYSVVRTDKANVQFQNVQNGSILNIREKDLERMKTEDLNQIYSFCNDYNAHEYNVISKEQGLYVVSGETLVKYIGSKTTAYVPADVSRVNDDAFPDKIKKIISLSDANVDNLRKPKVTVFDYDKLVKLRTEDELKKAGLTQKEAKTVIRQIKCDVEYKNVVSEIIKEQTEPEASNDETEEISRDNSPERDSSELNR